MKKPPFEMKSSRYADYRRDGVWKITGRASFVWEQILQARVAGVPGVYEIKRSEKGSPWHRINLTIEEAEGLLSEYGIFGKQRVKQMRAFRASRKERGLEVG
jgi:hypothetical protein